MTQATGRPVFLDAPEGRQDEGTLPTLHTPPEKVDFQWEEGWFFLGSYETTIHHEGFPRVDGAHLDARGIGAIELFGGTLEFTDGDGRQQRVELGEERHAGPAGVEALGTRVLRSAYIEGVVAWTQVPLGEEWGFAAPAIRMEIDGDARWEAATGRVRVADAWHDIERAPLHIRGETRVVIQRTGAGLLDDPASYAGDAEASYVRVGGQVATGDTTGPAAAAKLGLAALLLALLTLTTSAAADLAARVLVPLYSRLSRADVLNHPTRAAIREIVTAEPGIHLRELHRIVGGAWGPFSFHVRMMEKMGAIELRREGRYVAATAPGLARAPDVPRADVQRRIIAGLAARDGAAERAALEAELRVSRQLLRYHLRRLLADGRVREEGGRIVLAAPGHATDPQTFAPVDS
jgi:DNA-binding transcriptional ArsR family regulator